MELIKPKDLPQRYCLVCRVMFQPVRQIHLYHDGDKSACWRMMVDAIAKSWRDGTYMAAVIEQDGRCFFCGLPSVQTRSLENPTRPLAVVETGPPPLGQATAAKLPGPDEPLIQLVTTIMWPEYLTRVGGEYRIAAGCSPCRSAYYKMRAEDPVIGILGPDGKLIFPNKD